MNQSLEKNKYKTFDYKNLLDDYISSANIDEIKKKAEKMKFSSYSEIFVCSETDRGNHEDDVDLQSSNIIDNIVNVDKAVAGQENAEVVFAPDENDENQFQLKQKIIAAKTKDEDLSNAVLPKNHSIIKSNKFKNCSELIIKSLIKRRGQERFKPYIQQLLKKNRRNEPLIIDQNISLKLQNLTAKFGEVQKTFENSNAPKNKMQNANTAGISKLALGCNKNSTQNLTDYQIALKSPSLAGTNTFNNALTMESSSSTYANNGFSSLSDNRTSLKRPLSSGLSVTSNNATNTLNSVQQSVQNTLLNGMTAYNGNLHSLQSTLSAGITGFNTIRNSLPNNLVSGFNNNIYDSMQSSFANGNTFPNNLTNTIYPLTGQNFILNANGGNLIGNNFLGNNILLSNSIFEQASNNFLPLSLLPSATSNFTPTNFATLTPNINTTNPGFPMLNAINLGMDLSRNLNAGGRFLPISNNLNNGFITGGSINIPYEVQHFRNN